MPARLFGVRPLVIAAVVSIAACGHQPSSGSSSGGWSDYQLYTHCGIVEANIFGQWYRAVPPESDGSGNPPRGWDNPVQDGQVRVVSSTVIDYRDVAGHTVRFVLRPGATGPLQVCS